MAKVVNTNQISDFDAVRLAVASPEDILGWSYGEVTKPETINYRTQKPERDGLFCEKIFGPTKDINPYDNKLKGVRSREMAVDKNGELVTKSIVRRERMGHIALAAPVAHIWFMRGAPSAMSLLLGMTVKNIERVVYFASYVILSVDEEKRTQMLADLDAEDSAARMAIKLRYQKAAEEEGANVEALAEEQSREIEELNANYQAKKAQLDNLSKGALISETDFRNLPEEFEEIIEVGMGGEAIKKLLDEIDIDEMIEGLKEEAEKAKGQREKKILKRLKTIEGMKNAGVKPGDLCLTILPVIPPDLRPMVQLTGGRFATSDLNDLYRRVINRNNRLKKLIELNAPMVIKRNEMRMLQEAVDSLIDNNASRSGRTANTTGGRRKLKSLSDMLKGKQGRFRQNLLGKRVDYSGRSVIVVGPTLKAHQCGLPKQMALELFKPFIISWLIEHDYAHNIRSATRLIEAGESCVWDALDEVIVGKYVLLNRAPSLHRLSIQAFQPKLVDGKAIQLHPLVANGFNADYDGDQMAVHLPLSDAAQAEARDLMSISHNLLKPADGQPVLSVDQDVVYGNYYLTYDKQSEMQKDRKAFASVYEAEMAYDAGKIALQTPIRVYAKGEIRDTTLGRVFFNEILPEDYPYDNNPQTKKQINKVLANIFAKYGADMTVKIADKIKGLSFRFVTKSGLSIGKEDYTVFESDKIPQIIAEGDAKTTLIQEQYDQGLLTDQERYNLIIDNWHKAIDDVSEEISSRVATEGADSPVGLMAVSGSRGNATNIRLASGLTGIMVDATNREIELPIRSNYTHGMSSLEAFVATRGARQGLISTALKTADSGYLTRRLVDVAQDVFSTVDSDEKDPGFEIFRSESEETMISFGDRLYGRFTAEAIPGYVEADQLITREIANAIEADSNIESAKIQSVLSTPNLSGIPQKSYGIDMATGLLVGSAEPVGVIAAQSVGEPGTQLTLNTFHSSGVAGSGAISQGLPRVEELLEARAPKGQAYITEVAGLVDIWEDGNMNVIQITPQVSKDENGEEISTNPVRYEIPNTVALTVSKNDLVAAGDRLTIGSLNLHDLMRLKGVEATQRYIMNEILRIYAAQGQDIASKHLEVIVRQMFSRVLVEDAGDSDFVTGDVVSKAAVIESNKLLAAEGKKEITYKQQLLGITKVAIYSDSFLSAASFQNTTSVLINAATSGRVDRLHGLKENVIIGRKIPVGTGARKAEIPEEAEENSEETEE
ncbi:MAG: DNA-directed RNA polymerase subunit beta' [bacterium]|nr:DNA-directed RNA polymerase subunit beta' [bacterium]